MSPPPRGRSPGHQALFDRFIGDDPERLASYERARANAEVAQAVYDLRKKVGLSQRELAERVGTTASVICRLEDADYEGHSLSMLRRVAAALGRRVRIVFSPAPAKVATVKVSKRPAVKTEAAGTKTAKAETARAFAVKAKTSKARSTVPKKSKPPKKRARR